MTIQVSTGFKTAILGTRSFKSIFDQGRVLVYSGAQPASADAAATGTLLATMTLQGQPWLPNGSAGGLVFDQLGAWMAKPEVAQWKITVTATGIAGWFRLVGPATDDGFLSLTAPRIDGFVSNDSNANLFLVNPSLTAGQSLEVQQFSFTFPPIA